MRQISGGARTDSFVGTDFSYEDLAIMADVLDWGEDSAHAALAGSETIDGHVSDIIELTHHAGRRRELRQDPPVARARRPGGAQVRIRRRARGSWPRRCCCPTSARCSGIPAAHRLEMRNERSGSHTLVELTELQYNTGLDDDVFTQRRLEKGIS